MSHLKRIRKRKTRQMDLYKHPHRDHSSIRRTKKEIRNALCVGLTDTSQMFIFSHLCFLLFLCAPFVYIQEERRCNSTPPFQTRQPLSSSLFGRECNAATSLFIIIVEVQRRRELLTERMIAPLFSFSCSFLLARVSCYLGGNRRRMAGDCGT